MSTTAPGLYFSVEPPSLAPSPLRTDIAGFVGNTHRGLVGVPVRVSGWRHYLQEFGVLNSRVDTPYAIRGYFENGGEVAYVVRLSGQSHKTAVANWRVGTIDPNSGQWDAGAPAVGGFVSDEYRVFASSPGAWANGTQVAIRYNHRGIDGQPEVSLTVRSPGETTEILNGLKPSELEQQIALRSRLIRLEASGASPPPPDTVPAPGPSVIMWNVVLSDGQEGDISYLRDYGEAVDKLGDEAEVALLVMPDLYRDIPSEAEQTEILRKLNNQAEQLKDRQVLLDVPPDINNAVDAANWVTQTRLRLDSDTLYNFVSYFPRLRINDPLGGVNSPQREIMPSGHVAGLISRLDRERGAHHTPANAVLYEAVDTTLELGLAEQDLLIQNGLNLVRCAPSRGLQVWGGRTLVRGEQDRKRLFLAHRRLIHRLVRAIQRVAEPLVFDTNGPELWLTFVRSITSVLLEAFRAGALKGVRHEEAFRVRCDETTNPQSEIDHGHLLCEIELAPAEPMEFIMLRIALDTQGKLEVIEP